MIPDWRGDLVVVAGTGPTLTSGDLCRARAAGCRVLVIGMAWYLAPWADFTVTVGPDFWIENSAALGSSPEFIFEQHGIKAYIPRAWDASSTFYRPMSCVWNCSYRRSCQAAGRPARVCTQLSVCTRSKSRSRRSRGGLSCWDMMAGPTAGAGIDTTFAHNPQAKPLRWPPRWIFTSRERGAAAGHRCPELQPRLGDRRLSRACPSRKRLPQ